MNFKAICTDIDGTLLNKDRNLSTKTLESFQRVSDKVEIILASSRMPSAMRYFQKELRIEHSPLICYNGGYVVQYNGKNQAKIFDSQVVSLNFCKLIADFVKKTSLHLSLYYEDSWYAPQIDFWTNREINNTRVQPIIMDNPSTIKLWESTEVPGAHKLMCMGDEGEIQQLLTFLQNNDTNNLNLYLSKPTYLEIASNHTSKAIALKKLIELLYEFEKDEIIAFGDNYNDIDLLKYVGLGIAVGNAKDEVKEIAKEITLKNTDDGVAISIDKHFP